MHLQGYSFALFRKFVCIAHTRTQTLTHTARVCIPQMGLKTECTVCKHTNVEFNFPSSFLNKDVWYEIFVLNTQTKSKWNKPSVSLVSRRTRWCIWECVVFLIENICRERERERVGDSYDAMLICMHTDEDETRKWGVAKGVCGFTRTQISDLLHAATVYFFFFIWKFILSITESVCEFSQRMFNFRWCIFVFSGCECHLM